MIAEAEIRRLAAQMYVDPMVVDLDYSLGWFLLGLIRTQHFAAHVRFKGGTCLRKCYFPNYRFSEDLDFTLTGHTYAEELKNWLVETVAWVADHDGPDFHSEPLRLEVVNDEYGAESFQARMYYRGPLRWGGSPRTIRIDITRHEQLLLPPARRSLIHPYSDQLAFQEAALECYALEEVMAEKLRAVGGQRRFAISRDIYDIYNLSHTGVNMAQVKKILPEKFQARGLQLSNFSLERRKNEFKLDWDRRLSYLVKSNQTDFETVWQEIIQLLGIL